MIEIKGVYLKIMEVLWESDEPISAEQISERNPELKISTIRTYLKKLLEANYIKVAGSILNGTVYARTYVPILEKKKYLAENVNMRNVNASELMASILDSEEVSLETLLDLQRTIELKRKELEGKI